MKDILNINGGKICKYTKKVSGAIRKLASLIAKSPVATWALSHGRIDSRLSPKLGAIVGKTDEEDAKKQAGELAQVLSEAKSQGLFDGHIVSVRGNIKGSISLKVDGTPMGRFLAECIAKTVNSANRSICRGEFPMELAVPVPGADELSDEDKEFDGIFEHEGSQWKLNTSITRALLKAMGVKLPEFDEDEISMGAVMLREVNTLVEARKGARKGATK